MVLLLTCCLLLLPFRESVIVLCLVVCYFMSILVLQSSWWGRESWLPCLVCLPDVSWLLCGSSSWCHRFVCSLWLWYFLIILTIFGWRTFEQRWADVRQCKIVYSYMAMPLPECIQPVAQNNLQECHPSVFGLRQLQTYIWTFTWFFFYWLLNAQWNALS